MEYLQAITIVYLAIGGLMLASILINEFLDDKEKRIQAEWWAWAAIPIIWPVFFIFGAGEVAKRLLNKMFR